MFGRRSAASGEAIANAGSKRKKLTTEDTTERRGRREVERPKVGPEGARRAGASESKHTEGKKRFSMAFLDRMTRFTGRFWGVLETFLLAAVIRKFRITEFPSVLSVSSVVK
jgi:hypothetical protein